MKKMLVAYICALSLCVAATAVHAHGLGYTMIESDNTVSFEALFSSGDPVSYAEVFIYSPDNKDVEFQNGRTDAAGRFAFLPNKNGLWKVVVNAGMGHRLTFDTPVELGKKLKAESSSPVPTSQFVPALLGLSLILNIFLVLRRRNKS
ncbi:MAG: hypothetical protein ACNI27_05805 [Desulfovibrio sp.]